MCQNDLIPFQHIYEESKNIYKLLFTLNGAAIVSLVTLIVSYDKNDFLKVFEILSGNLFWFVLTILFSLCIILCIYTCKFYIWVRRDRIYSHKFVKYYNNAIIAGMWSVNLILFLNFIYGISYLYSVLKYGITIL